LRHNDRRFRVYMVAEWDILDAFTLRDDPPELLELPRLPGLPDDARILAVQHDFYVKAFAFLVESASFDPVPEGQPFPRAEQVLAVERRQVRIVRRGEMCEDPVYAIAEEPHA
jgi:hypothetical protein